MSSRLKKLKWVLVLSILSIGWLTFQEYYVGRTIGTRLGTIVTQPSGYGLYSRELAQARLNGEVKIVSEGLGALAGSTRYVVLRLVSGPGLGVIASPIVAVFDPNTPPFHFSQILNLVWGLKEGTVAEIRDRNDQIWTIEVQKVCDLEKGKKLALKNLICPSLPPDVITIPALAKLTEFTSPEARALIDRIFAIGMDAPYVYLTQYCLAFSQERCEKLCQYLIEKVGADAQNPRGNAIYRDALDDIVRMRPEQIPYVTKSALRSPSEELSRYGVYLLLENVSATSVGVLLEAFDEKVTSWRFISEKLFEGLNSTIPHDQEKWVAAFDAQTRPLPEAIQSQLTAIKGVRDSAARSLPSGWQTQPYDTGRSYNRRRRE